MTTLILRELAVQNLALLEDVRVELAAGFCAWTGETGAGKTPLLAALGLLPGDRGMMRGEARDETTRKEAAAMLAAAKRRW
jgi:DNA repair ATPase RecN